MTSKVEICNKALTLLSANLITAFDPDESTEAALCVTNYESARRYTLEQRAWTFASKRVILNASGAVPAWGYGHTFNLPADFIRMVFLSRDPIFKDGGDNVEYKREGADLVANVSILYMKYVFDLVEEDRFTSTFVEAMSHWLAYLMATPLTEDKGLKDSLQAAFTSLTRDGAALDGLTGSSDRIQSSQLIDARFRTGKSLTRRI
jgi:hypothetical protein